MLENTTGFAKFSGDRVSNRRDPKIVSENSEIAIDRQAGIRGLEVIRGTDRPDTLCGRHGRSRRVGKGAVIYRTALSGMQSVFEPQPHNS